MGGRSWFFGSKHPQSKEKDPDDTLQRKATTTLTNASASTSLTTHHGHASATKPEDVETVRTTSYLATINAIDNLQLFDVDRFTQLSMNETMIKQPDAILKLNRASSVVPNPRTHIKLKEKNHDVRTAYINANYISTFDGVKVGYIATQNPLPDTVDAFWRTVWKVDAHVVVMLTSLEVVESNEPQCERYWPASINDTMVFGKIHVMLTASEHYEGYSVNTLSVRKQGHTRQLRQFIFDSWPHDRCPQSPHTVLTMLNDCTRFSNDLKKHPWVVHCINGVGRTGSLIAIDQGVRMLHANMKCDVIEVIKKLRKDRASMVPTPSLARFTSDALVHLAHNTTGTTQPILNATMSLAGATKTYTQAAVDVGDGRLLRDSEIFPEPQHAMVVAPWSLSTYAKLPMRLMKESEAEPNTKKHNRYSNILPNPKTRVRLPQIDDDQLSTYINANYVVGYDNTERSYIATQGPLHATTIAFWRMVWLTKSQCIVMATGVVENGQKKCVRYWPEQDYRVQYGDVKVLCQNTEEHEAYTVHTLHISLQDVTIPARTVKHFWFTTWPDHGVPSSSVGVVSMLAHCRRLGNDLVHQPWVVHCSAGIGRTGAIISIDHGIRLLETTGSCDVATIITRVR